MQLEFKYDWMVSSLTSPPTPTAPRNHTEYQQTTCPMQFWQCLFLHGSCPVFQHADRNRYSGLCWPRLFPEVGWYSKTCLNSLLNLVMESAVRIWICLDGFFTHFTTNTTSTTQPHRIPANNLHNAIFTMFALAWIPSCFQACWKKHVQWIMLAKAFPRVELAWIAWILCEFWWWKVQWEYGYVWMVSPLTSPPTPTPPTPPTPHNHTEYQPNLCNEIFPMFVLALILSCFPACWQKHVQ